MPLSYYYTLYPAYAVALLSWIFLAPKLGLEPDGTEISFEKPGLELLYAVIAIGLCLAIGQLYIHGFLLPSNHAGKFLTESLNQMLIFSPFPLLMLIRKHSLQTAWIPSTNKLLSLLLGFGLACISIAVFLLIKGEVSTYFSIIQEVYDYENLPQLTQVFLEDFTIAVCFIRFRAVLGNTWSWVLVAVLFSAGHIPAMLSEGIEAEAFMGLLLDALLAFGVLWVLIRYRNILWFWMVHYAMDMMQFID